MTLKKQLLLLAVAAFVIDAVFTEKPFWASKYIWDELDPKLVGQVIQFTEPVGYGLLEKKDIGTNHSKEEVAIGRKLVLVRSYRAIDYSGFENIDQNMDFKIVRTAWQRSTWLDRQFVGDMRKALIVDMNGIQSVVPIFMFSYSNKQGLANLKNEGKFSD